MTPKTVYPLSEARERAACDAIEQAFKTAAERGTSAILSAIADPKVRADAAFVLGVKPSART